MSATLYGREPSFASCRHLGGSLDLGYDTEQSGPRENGLEQQFRQNSRPEGDYNTHYDSQRVLSTSAADFNGDPRRLRPEIGRSALRRIMLDALPLDPVEWGHALSSVYSRGNGEHELTFANGYTAVSDILRARTVHTRTCAGPIYHAIAGAEVSLYPATAALPQLVETVTDVGKGTMYAEEDGRMLCAKVNGDGRIGTYLSFPDSRDWALPQDTDAARKKLLEAYEGWVGWMRMMTERWCDGEAMYARLLNHLPFDHC